jgi:hypothetical protein
MPKIGNKRERIKEADIDEVLEFTAHYNSELGFYAQLPMKLIENFDALTDEELKQFSARRKYARKWSHSDEPHQRIVTASTEDKLVAAMKILVLHLLRLTLVKVPVIVVEFENQGGREANTFYNTKEPKRPGHEDEDDDDDEDEDPDEKDFNVLPKVGLTFEVTYCFRVSTRGTKDKFYKYSNYDAFGDKREKREEVHVSSWRSNDIVIPDTPENRQFIEELHHALHLLVHKFKLFTATADDMLKVIEARQKLLTLKS